MILNSSQAVALRILELLQEKQMTQYDLFKKSGVPEPTISALVRRLHKTSKLSTLIQVCNGFGISLQEFFTAPYFNDKELLEE